MRHYIDKDNGFFEIFNEETGAYVRSGIIQNGQDTQIDPFQRNYPALIDIGIMQRCVCASRCNVDCYQKAIDRVGDNMSLADYEAIMEQSRGKVFQVALGGAGDPDTHENFAEILAMTKANEIVPNFTTSGIALTNSKAKLCKEFCGAVAVSEHNTEYTNNAVKLLLHYGVKTNIHYVLSSESIDLAIERLSHNYYAGLNAVVFLLYKPIGLGKRSKVLNLTDERVKKFFEIVDSNKCDHKIGFDSCTCPGIINFTHNIDMASMDFCEAARYSMYIDAGMNAMPCSFGNQNAKYFVSLRDYTINEAWNSDVFNEFRDRMRTSCVTCKDRLSCSGGCPICRDIVLCNRDEKHYDNE